MRSSTVRRRSVVSLAVALFLPSLLAPVHAQTVAGPARNIVLIGWDGAQRNHVKESLDRGQLPRLGQLASEGVIVAIDVLGTTDTKAGWAQILTGYSPEITGVSSNLRYGPIRRGYTVFERLEEFFGRDNFVTVAVISKGSNIGGEEGQPFFNAKDSLDVFMNELRNDKKVGSTALALLDKYRQGPFFFFVHFQGADVKGHFFGENSPEYERALISADTWTGRIIDKLKELQIYEETLVYVAGDHGFGEGAKFHFEAPYTFLATNDREVMRRGYREDIAPTILERFGMDLETIDPPLSGHTLTKPYSPPIW